MLVLGAIVDQEQQAGCGEALNQAVQEGLGLGVDPVQVLEDQEQGLDLTSRRSRRLMACKVRWRRCGGSRACHA